MPISKECAIELCKTLVASALCGGSMLAKGLNPPVASVELALGATALIASFGQERAQRLDNIIGKMANQVVRDSDVWIAARGPGARARRDAALPTVQQIAPRIEPTGNELAKLGFNRARIIEFYLKRASQLADGGIFADQPENEIARELLGDIVGYTFDIIRNTPEMQSHALEEILRRQDELPDAVARKVVDALEDRLVAMAEERGLDRGAIVALARRLKPGENLSFEQAVRELEHAVDVALDLIAGGARSSNLGSFIDAILKRISDETQAQQFDRAAAEVDSGLREIALREKEQQTDNLRARIAVIESGIKVDILRRDPERVADRIEALTAFQTNENPATWTAAFHKQWDRYQQEGEEKGINFSLEIAATLASRMLRDASTPTQRGDARNLLGTALRLLGTRESGTARLEEAIIAYREALGEHTRDPLGWAMTQNNLGNALSVLGERESNTARLEEAVTAFREALRVSPRDKVPLHWAMTQNNLGNALSVLGTRESGTARLEEAITAYREALKEHSHDKAPLQWAMVQNNLGNALWSLGARESGTARLEEATATYREALKEYTREKFPLRWAATQNNLGAALQSLGERESGTARLEEAAATYRAVLKEHTRDKVPPQWAATQNNLGTALWSLGERESGTARLEEAAIAFRQALEERRPDNAPYHYEKTMRNLAGVEKLLGERRAEKK